MGRARLHMLQPILQGSSVETSALYSVLQTPRNVSTRGPYISRITSPEQCEHKSAAKRRDAGVGNDAHSDVISD